MAGLCFESNTPGLSLAFSQLPVQEGGGGGGEKKKKKRKKEGSILLWHSRNGQGQFRLKTMIGTGCGEAKPTK